ncbi:MAG: RnfABCDGE type electron transport complex subunit D [Clostridia bacterium]|nr:RnfABCDGE type electron transport complex subunit D [Clostridia bacterium]
MKSQRIFGDYLLMLIFPCLMSIWYHGMKAVYVLLISAVTCVLCDFFASIIIYRQYFAADLSALCTGLMIALMLPADIPLYVPVLACSFAILVLKIPFGGGMRVPFVPAAAGFAFVAVCFRDPVFTYSTGRDYMITSSVGSVLQSGGAVRLNSINFLDLITGNVYGPMGCGCILIFIGCIVFLLIRRKSALLSTAGFLGACLVFSLVFSRTNGSRFVGAVLEFCSGSLMFASVFLITDYSTLPKHKPNKIVYGVFCGIICMVMRHLGAFEEPVCFAVLLANAFTPLLDILTGRVIDFISAPGKGREVKADE